MTSCALGTIRPVARSMRTAFMSGTCLINTAIVSGPVFAIVCGGSPLSSPLPSVACVALITSIPTGNHTSGSGAICRGSGLEALSQREMDVQRQLQSQAQTGVVEVVTSDIANPIEPVEHGVAMHAEPLCCFLWTPIRREKCVECADQIGVVLPVVGK